MKVDGKSSGLELPQVPEASELSEIVAASFCSISNCFPPAESI